MFGKGIYFADMVSKSAGYCCTSASNNVGFLLLSDVALGSTHDLLGANSNLPVGMPKGKHSVKGELNKKFSFNFFDLDLFRCGRFF